MSSEISKLQQQIAVLQRKLSREQLARVAAEDMLNNYSRDAYLANQNLRRALSETRAIYQHLLTHLPEEKAAKLDTAPKAEFHVSGMVDRMTLLSQLAAGIAHEINNPIGFIKSNCEIQGHMLKDLFEAWDELKSEIGQSDSELKDLPHDLELKYMLQDVREMLDDIQQSSLEGASRIAEIVSSLQIFSSPVTVEKRWEEIDDLLQYCVEDIIHKLPASISLEIMPTLTHEGIEVNRKQIKRVIESLIENAVDACGKKGAITVATAIMPGALKIYIKDNGEGIKPEHKPLIFTPFFTTKPPGGGTGLGLSVAQALMESHTGWINIDSTEGVGTTVTLNFPLS